MTELTERQKQILQKAINIIANDGIQNLTIKNLAKAVGVTEAALYRHYENKHAIMLAITDLFEEFSVNKNSGNGLAGIRSFVMDRYNKFTANPELAKVMFSEAIKRIQVFEISSGVTIDRVASGCIVSNS
ncbi:MAG: TetR/AcrR family transcriptional regulator [Candidatus Delongbacteria bacterium]